MAAAQPTPVDTPVERLYAHHDPALRRFLTRMLGCEHEAADAAQDAYVRVLRLARWREVENGRAYLFQTAANVARDRLARERTRRGSLAPIAHAPPPDPLGPDAERIADARGHLRLLAAEAEALPPRCREVFRLSRIEGLGNGAIAARLGISRNMVEKHIIKALLRFRRCVEPEAC